MGHFKNIVTERMEDERLAREVATQAAIMAPLWTKEAVQNLLATNDKAVGRALLVLFNNQTEDERATDQTRHSNRRGFTQADAPRMTSMAKFFKAKGYLTARQLAWLRGRRSDRFHSRIGKYHAQLIAAIR